MSIISNLNIINDTVSFDLLNEFDYFKISFVNAIRRTIISDIYVYGIDDNSIIFEENTSMLNNEFLKHRLTLVPIVSNLENIDYEKIIISCNKNNDTENIKNIYVNDFICKNIDTNEIIDNKVIFRYPDILFAKIKNNQQIIFESKLIMNNPEKGGSFFSTVSKCVYTFKINEKKVNDLEINMNELEKKSFNNQDIERIYEKNKNGAPNIYKFVVESIGYYDPLTVVKKGIDSLIDRLQIVKNTKIKILEDYENNDFFYFSFEDENETIGNLLSTYIDGNDNVFYCGYVIDHPLKKIFVLKIKLKDNNTLENNIKVIEDNIDSILKLLNNINNELRIVK
jgi:DNA-directed RNA polymerase subunit L